MPRLSDFQSSDLASAYGQAQADAAYMSQNNLHVADTLRGIADTYPHLTAAVAMSMAEAGYNKDSPEVKSLASAQIKADSKSIWGRVTSGFHRTINDLKVGTQVGTTALAAPYEYVQGQFRTGIHDAKTGNLAGAAASVGLVPNIVAGQFDDIAKQTRLGAAVQVSHQTGLSLPEVLNNTPQIGRDGDPAILSSRQEQSWFTGPNSLAEKQQVVNARAADTTAGRATTFGRFAGHIVGLDPGGASYNLLNRYFSASHYMGDMNPEQMTNAVRTLVEGGIDSTAAIYGDPIGRVSIARANHLREAGEFGGATKLIDVPHTIRTTATVKDKATGITTAEPMLVDGETRRTVVFANAEHWITNSKHGDKLANYLAHETDYERAAHVLGRDTHPTTILNVLAETDPARMKNVLLAEAGKGFFTRAAEPAAADMSAVGLNPLGGKLAGVASAMTRRNTARWAQLAPSEQFMPKSDPAWAVEQYRRQLHALRVGTAKNHLTPTFISKNIEDFARGLVDPNADWSVPYKATADALRQALKDNGAKPHHAQQLSRIWEDLNTSERNYWIDRNSGEVKNAFATVDGEDMPLSKAAASAEMFTDGIPMLNLHDITQATSKLRRLYQSKGWEGLVDTGDFVTGFFKFMVLPARGGAWLTRNVAEAEGRVAVEGLDGVFNSPLKALAWRVGDNPNSKASKLLGRAGRAEGRGSVDAAGEDFQTRLELEDNASAFSRALEHKGGPWNDDRAIYTKQYEIARRTPDRIDPGWHEGQRFNLAKLSASPEYRMSVTAESPLHAKNLFWRSSVREKMALQQPELRTRQGADAYMEKVAERVQDMSNGSPAIREAIATGKLDGVALTARDGTGNLAPNPKVLDVIEKHHMDLPSYTVTPGQISARPHGGAIARGADTIERQFFARMFHAFGSMPNNRFVNSPLFRELHWREAIRLAPLASEPERAKILQAATASRLDRGMIGQLKNMTGPAGELTAEDVRDLADAKAFNRWMDIVYNSHNKGNWTRSVRMLSPFAAAVADMYRFWGKRLVQNPLVIHRVEQGLHGARQSGFFYVDDNGQERFGYPVTAGISRMLTGVPEALSGTVKGANMITSGLMPGWGPIVSWPAATLPDKPMLDPLKQFINPYGNPDASGGLLEGMAPGNVQRVLAAFGLGTPAAKRAYQKTLNNTMAYLASTGDYGNSVAEQERLRSDAQAKGKALYILQAFAQTNMPSSPKADFYYKDPTGRAQQLAYVAADYRKLLREDPDTATQKLLTMYGDAAFVAVTGSTTGSAQLTTKAAHDLARSHPEVTDRYADVWSFFTDPNSPYSQDEFTRQVTAGDRQTRSLKEVQVAAQTSLANTMYHQYKDQYGPYPTPQQGDYLRYVKGQIKAKFPLWDQSFDESAVEKRVTETFAAAKDPVFANTDIASAVTAYEAARQQVIDDANSKGLTSSDTGWGRAKATAGHRAYLRSVAAQIVQQVPGFQTLWDRVFSSEMIDDAGTQ